MGARFRSWWQQIKKHRVAIGVVAIVLVVAITLIIVGYWFDWTGFNGYNKITVAHTISGTNAGTVTRTEEYQPGKGLWDWLQLLGVLAIPVVVGFGAVWFTTRQGKVADAENKDNQRETALQAYIDKISELLLKEHLGERTADDQLNPEFEQVRKIARVRTITILTQLDARRIGYVFAFLREAGLMSTTSNDSVVSLKDVDLRAVKWDEANLNGANLNGANLNGAILSGANLSNANLNGANLSDANLNGAHLYDAHLSGANLSNANLNGAILSGANFYDANLYEANLILATLNVANLSDANLSRANFTGANLYKVDLSFANLSEATLSEANFYEANLSNATLSEANLSKAKITEEQLAKAMALEGATMPDGSIHP